MWRDGAAGRELQKAMVEVACKRLFDVGALDQCVSSGRGAFSSGTAWAACARLLGPPHWNMDSVLERHFGMRDQWSDSVRALHRAVWVGDHDLEIVRLSALLPATLDGQPIQFQKKLSELFSPILTVMQQRDTEAQRLQTAAERQKEAAAAEAAAMQSESSMSMPSMLSSQSAVIDGDVTDDLCKDQDSASKRALCEQLNKDAKKKQADALQAQVCFAAAEVFRSRVVVVDSTASAKAYMESCCKDGLRARVVYLDWTQYASLQSKGAWSKVLSRQPSKDILPEPIDGPLQCGTLACNQMRAGPADRQTRTNTNPQTLIHIHMFTPAGQLQTLATSHTNNF